MNLNNLKNVILNTKIKFKIGLLVLILVIGSFSGDGDGIIASHETFNSSRTETFIFSSNGTNIMILARMSRPLLIVIQYFNQVPRDGIVLESIVV